MKKSYEDFFQELEGNPPYPYQRALVEEQPRLLSIPTGLGKTAAVVLMWLYARLTKADETPRRLVYCLPMRALVSQVYRRCEEWLAKAAPSFEEAGLQLPSLHMLMGGFVEEEWERKPAEPALLVGTQDMLMSRALNRGYDMSRFRWPVHFGWLNNDALWVLDEPQLMGVAVETSAQLDALRRRLGTSAPCKTIWMSATLERSQLATVDQEEHLDAWSIQSLTAADKASKVVQKRTNAAKVIQTTPLLSLTKGYEKKLATEVAAHHQEGTLTLVVMNQVARATAVYQAVRQALATGSGKKRKYPDNVMLLHSRFRPRERQELEERLLEASGGGTDLIVVATQVVEAGLDLDAQTLITELCPWPSFVQRLGRCNRAGSLKAGGRVFWLDLNLDDKSHVAPYDEEELGVSRALLQEHGEDGSPAALSQTSDEKYRAPLVIRPVLRRKDLLSLFDTTPDLLGDDVDVSRFVRDGHDTSVRVYWREFTLVHDAPDDRRPPVREELCAVPIGALSDFLKKLQVWNKNRDVKDRLWAWTWDYLEGAWERVSRPRPGLTVMLPAKVGGYSPILGWTGERAKAGEAVASAGVSTAKASRQWEGAGDDGEAEGEWVLLSQHLKDAEQAAQALMAQIDVPQEHREAVCTSALWHDVGKAHKDGFQAKLSSHLETNNPNAPHAPPEPNRLWAKSPKQRGGGKGRPLYRHELASALAWHQLHPEHPQRDLIAYLIAAHHGKVRLSIRALPHESGNPDAPTQPFARGVWQDDVLETFSVPGDQEYEGVRLDLSMMNLGEGSWLERTLALRDAPTLGPFRLGYLESLLRIADWTASAGENLQYSPTNASKTSPAQHSKPVAVAATEESAVEEALAASPADKSPQEAPAFEGAQMLMFGGHNEEGDNS